MDVIALIVSILAIVLSVISFFSRNKFYKFSFRPHLNFFLKTNSSSKSVLLKIRNKGVGPAIIEKISILNENQDLSPDGKIQEYFINKIFKSDNNKAGDLEINKPIGTGILIKGEAISPNEEFSLLKVEVETKEQYNKLRSVMGDLKAKCEYKSIYDESYKIQMELNPLGH